MLKYTRGILRLNETRNLCITFIFSYVDQYKHFGYKLVALLGIRKPRNVHKLQDEELNNYNALVIITS